MIVPSDPASLGEVVEKLRAKGWLLIPLKHGGKTPPEGIRWRDRTFSGDDFRRIAERSGPLGIAIRLTNLVAIDVDADDPADAARLKHLAQGFLGETPAIRIGREPRCILLRRTPPCVAIEFWQRPGLIDVLSGSGRYIVAFNQHPVTGEPYRWVGTGGSPLDFGPDQLPVTDIADIERLKQAIEGGPSAGLTPSLPSGLAHSHPQRRNEQHAFDQVARHQRGSGRIADGRDALLTKIVCAEIGRSKQQGRALIRGEIIDAVWLRFEREADLARPKGGGGGRWSTRDVETKVDYALRPPRLARVSPSAAKGIWTLNRKLAFKAVVDADRRLNASDQKVAWAMLEAVRDARGLSYLCSETIARQTGLHQVTARGSRRKLIRLDYFQEVKRGGKHKPTVCSPNAALVMHIAATIPSAASVFIASRSETALASDHAIEVFGIEAKSGQFVASETTVILTRGVGVEEDGKGRRAGKDEQRSLFPQGALSDPLAFGRWLKEQRCALGFSQRALAPKIGCSQSHLANVERGHDKLGSWARRRLDELIRGAG
jgi:Bifunctional DNA primase/polymerase, N-terminal/Helix-turn-helix